MQTNQGAPHVTVDAPTFYGISANDISVNDLDGNLHLNSSKFKEMIIEFRKSRKAVPPIFNIEQVSEVRLLGITLDSLTFKPNVEKTARSATSNLS